MVVGGGRPTVGGMKITSAEFLISAPDLASCPEARLPEFAFIGRSNVGKSSLINQLTGRSALAKVSGTPGKTQLINFFTVNRSWTLVDLPGYGYAKLSRERQSEFNAAVSDYLAQRQALLCIFSLVDSRIPPQDIDLRFLAWAAQESRPVAVVFTKTEKLSATALKRVVATFDAARAERHLPAPVATFTTSAMSGAGRSELLGFIADATKRGALPGTAASAAGSLTTDGHG